MKKEKKVKAEAEPAEEQPEQSEEVAKQTGTDEACVDQAQLLKATTTTLTVVSSYKQI